MAKRTPFTSQAERLERLIKNLQNEVAGIKTMVDVDRGVLTAQLIKVDDPSSPQIIRVSEGGSLEAGGEPLPWRAVIAEEASHTGDTNETELGKITVPGNSMGAHGFIRVHALYRALRNGQPGANHTFRARFGGIGGTIFSTYTANFANLMLDIVPKFIWNTGVTNAQGSGILQAHFHTRAGEAPYASAVDTTADVDISFTVQNANALHSAFLRSAFVEAFFSN